MYKASEGGMQAKHHKCARTKYQIISIYEAFNHGSIVRCCCCCWFLLTVFIVFRFIHFQVVWYYEIRKWIWNFKNDRFLAQRVVWRPIRIGEAIRTIHSFFFVSVDNISLEQITEREINKWTTTTTTKRKPQGRIHLFSVQLVSRCESTRCCGGVVWFC